MPSLPTASRSASCKIVVVCTWATPSGAAASGAASRASWGGVAADGRCSGRQPSAASVSVIASVAAGLGNRDMVFVHERHAAVRASGIVVDAEPIAGLSKHEHTVAGLEFAEHAGAAVPATPEDSRQAGRQPAGRRDAADRQAGDDER